MAELMKIADGYKIEPPPAFLASDNPEPMFASQPEAIVGTGFHADIEELDELIGNAVEEHERHSVTMDQNLVVPLHRILAIDRRLGSDSRFWAWLGVVRYPDLVAWRWAPGKKPDENGLFLRAAERFRGGHVRQAFARLWWAAELTVDESGKYDLTEQMLALSGFQDAYEAFFGRAFCQYRPALKAFLDIVGPRPGGTVKKAAREFGYALSTRVLEALSEDEIAEELHAILAEIDNGAGQNDG